MNACKHELELAVLCIRDALAEGRPCPPWVEAVYTDETRDALVTEAKRRNA